MCFAISTFLSSRAKSLVWSGRTAPEKHRSCEHCTGITVLEPVTVRIDGRDIWSISSKSAARLVAAVLQETLVEFELTVREVVALGRTPFRSPLAVGGVRETEKIEKIINELELAKLSNRKIGTLSGGERQRVMVARALVQEPRLLVLDEPTNHLDIRHQLEILDLVRNLGITVVCSLHDLDIAMKYSDTILALSNGGMIGFGPPDEVMSPELVSGAFAVNASLETLCASGEKRFVFHL